MMREKALMCNIKYNFIILLYNIFGGDYFRFVILVLLH